MSIDAPVLPHGNSNGVNASGEDGDWEDIPVSNLARQDSAVVTDAESSSVRSKTPSTPRSTTRRRKPGKVVFLAQPSASLRPIRPIQQTRPRQKPLIDIDSGQVQDALVHGTASSVRYFGAILTHALQLLRKPLGFLLCAWILGAIVLRISSIFRAPVCRMPFVSRSAFCQPPPAESAQWANFPQFVEIQSSNFEQLLDGAVGGSELSLEVKKAEMATKDLITLVKYSKLKSRDLLAESLGNFVEDARKTGRGLQQLTARINGAVENIVNVNDHALHMIESAKEQPKSLLRIIFPNGAAKPPTHEAVIEAFRTSMDANALEMRRLMLELQISYANLDRLDEHLVALHELCTQENITLNVDRDRLLSELWTILGGNRRRLRASADNLVLLRDLGEYRKRAAAHVAIALQTLQAMEADMEDLRERVAAPEIVGDRIPVEVHMKSIKSGIERLKVQRIKATEREDQMMNRLLAGS